MKKVMLISCLMAGVLFSGCVTDSTDGDSSGLTQLAAEAATMSQTDLEAMVTKYTAMISDKTALVDNLKAQLKEIPVTEMMGEKATALKSELSDTMTLISGLKDKLAVYTDALKAFQK
jgi:hypothetical protein